MSMRSRLRKATHLFTDKIDYSYLMKVVYEELLLAIEGFLIVVLNLVFDCFVLLKNLSAFTSDCDMKHLQSQTHSVGLNIAWLANSFF